MAQTMTPREKYDAEKLLSLTGAYNKRSLKKAYLNQVREWHPDVASSHGHTPEEAEAMTKRINNAFVALMSLFSGNVTTIQCEPSPVASGETSATDATTSRGSTREKTRYQSGPTASTRRQSGHTATTQTASEPSYAYSATTDARTSEPVGRSATPKNMAATIRYTRIVTDSNYVKWFVSGIGPHVVWALASLAFLVVGGLLMSGVFGLGGIFLLVQLLPIFIIYDIATGRGAEIVLSVADIWAVNKAVNGTM